MKTIDTLELYEAFCKAGLSKKASKAIAQAIFKAFSIKIETEEEDL